MKTIIGLFAFVLLCSCSNNDDDAVSQVRKYANRIVIERDGDISTMEITYNDNKQVTGFEYDDEIIPFEYENGKVVRVGQEDNFSGHYDLQYTNGYLTNLVTGERDYPVTFNAAKNSYTFVGGGLEVGLRGKDVSFIGQEDNYIQSFSYHNDLKGPLHDVQIDNVFPLTIFTENLYFYLSASPLNTITLNDNDDIEVYTAENTYDEDGYVTSTVLRLATEEIFTVQYFYIN